MKNFSMWGVVSLLAMALLACGGGEGKKSSSSAPTGCLEPCTDLLYLKVKVQTPFKIKSGYPRIDLAGDCNDANYPVHEIQWTLADSTGGSTSTGVGHCEAGRFFITLVDNGSHAVGASKTLSMKIVGKDSSQANAKTYENNATGALSFQVLVVQ